MVTTIDIKNCIDTDDYLKLLTKTVNSLSIRLRDGNIPIQVLNIDANSLNKAEITLNQLKSIYQDHEKIIYFIKLHKTEVKDDHDDYYSDNEDNDEIIEVLLSYKNFLIGYLVKYYLLKNNLKGLEKYLKTLRIPNSKKYLAKLKDIYSRL